MRLTTRQITWFSLLGMMAGVLGCTALGSGGPGPSTTASQPPVTTTLPSVTGNWTGTWTDTRYSKSGQLLATLTVTGNTFTGTGSIDLSQLGLGMETGTASGSISGNTLSFSFNSDTVGSGSGTLNGTSASGSGAVLGSLDFGAFTFSGTATDSAINGTFQFTSATGGNGTISMTKQ